MLRIYQARNGVIRVLLPTIARLSSLKVGRFDSVSRIGRCAIETRILEQTENVLSTPRYYFRLACVLPSGSDLLLCIARYRAIILRFFSPAHRFNVSLRVAALLLLVAIYRTVGGISPLVLLTLVNRGFEHPSYQSR